MNYFSSKNAAIMRFFLLLEKYFGREVHS